MTESSLSPPPSASVVIIGDEILSGKTRDSNSYYLARELWAVGVSLQRVAVVPDVVALIADEVARQSAAFDHVFTSGGVGPTHDDVTVDGVAAAFGVPVVAHPELAALLRARYGDRLRPTHLRMARVPKGVELLAADDLWLPAIRMGNVFVLPGIPELFRKKLEPLVRMVAARAFVARRVLLRRPEGEIAEALERVVAAFAEVAIGSYPAWNAPDHKVAITLTGRDASVVERATRRLVDELGADAVVRVE